MILFHREERGIQFNMGIPVPKVPVPDASYTLTHTLDYWPYKKFYTVNLSTVLKKGYKVFWYFCELVGLGLRLALQLFDIFEMRKSFEALGHGGPGWGKETDVDDWRHLHRL